MNSKDARKEIRSVTKQVTLQQLWQRNPVGFTISTGSLAVGIALLGYVFLASVVTGFTGKIALLLAVALLALGLATVVGSMAMFGPKGKLNQDRSARLTDAELDKLSADELHALCDFQRQQGNIDEADRISKHLLNLAESD